MDFAQSHIHVIHLKHRDTTFPFQKGLGAVVSKGCCELLGEPSCPLRTTISRVTYQTIPLHRERWKVQWCQWHHCALNVCCEHSHIAHIVTLHTDVCSPVGSPSPVRARTPSQNEGINSRMVSRFASGLLPSKIKPIPTCMLRSKSRAGWVLLAGNAIIPDHCWSGLVF